MAIETNELIDVKTLPPFKKFIMTIGNIPTSYLESMSYAELLMWFCNYLQNTVIPTVNNNGEAVEELQDFVTEYFNNLDITTEIANKLDKMASDGTLTNLIKGYVDPIYQEYQQTINETVNNQNETINTQNENIETIDQTVNNLSSRMDEFSTLTDGSTTGDAELIDGRIGYNDQVYVNIGQAIRSQAKGLFDESSNYVTRTRTINLFNKYDVIRGYYLTGTGGVGAAGGGVLSVSNYIPCNAGDVLIPSTNLTRVYYDTNKDILEVRTNTSTDFECPTDTAYARFTVATSLLDSYVIYKSTGAGDVTPKNNIPYYTYAITGDNSEVVDARVGYDNQTYLDLGQAIRSQLKGIFNESNNYVNRTRTINLLNKYDVIENYYVGANGNITPSNDFCVSNYIPCEAGDVLIPSTSLSRAYYDSDKELIEYRAYDNTDKTCPSNTAYARFTVAKSQLNNYVIYKSTSPNDTNAKTGIPYYTYSLIGSVNDYSNSTYQIFRKVCCVGDSLTEGYILNSDGVTAMVDNNYSWPHYMELTSGNTYYNCGSSGANTKTWLERSNGLLKAQSFGHVQAYIIGLGFNDGLPYEGYHLDLGYTTDIGTNNQTFYGCMSKIVRELHNISPDAFIFMQTIPSTNTERYSDYNDAIRYICNAYQNDYNTCLLDLYNYIDLYTTPLLNTDSAQGHFTAVGYQVCSKNLQYIWSNYINNNSEKFRDLPDVPTA